MVQALPGAPCRQLGLPPGLTSAGDFSHTHTQPDSKAFSRRRPKVGEASFRGRIPECSRTRACGRTGPA